MKKILLTLIILLCLCSCDRSYKCVVKYKVTYPDTTWVNTYEFDGSLYSHPNVYTRVSGVKTLEVYKTSTHICDEVISVPAGETNIEILDYKMYKYGIDIPKKRISKNENSER